ncbi:MAG: AraC family transcriptional regulator [Saprospiraceae bacterium]|nr:AraC family transcriptional regulator [Saprospiraceae bacterium]
MSLQIPSQFPAEKEDVILGFDNQTYLHYHRKQECEKRPVRLEQHLIMFILDGRKKMISLQGETWVHKNEVLFLKKGAYLSSEKILEDGLFSSMLFFIHEDFIQSFQNKYRSHLSEVQAKGVNMFKVERNEQLDSYIRSLLPYFDSRKPIAKPILKLKVEELLLNLLFAENNQQFSSFLASVGQRVTRNFRELMEENITRPLSLEDLAHLSNMSVSSFRRKFLEVFKETPARWMRLKRLDLAKVMLKSTDKNVSEVAMEVGFESVSHFIHLFKKQFGVTPKQVTA